MSMVTLSRRNLLTLLAKLEIPGSSRTIIKPDGTYVIAEPDELHYQGRVPPGPMTPETEEIATVIDHALTDWRSHAETPA